VPQYQPWHDDLHGSNSRLQIGRRGPFPREEHVLREEKSSWSGIEFFALISVNTSDAVGSKQTNSTKQRLKT
jgi:hypothetical protein